MELPVIKRILYTTDLSENARYAFAYAVSLSTLYQAQITLLHVIPEVPISLDTGLAGYITTEHWETIKAGHMDEAKQVLIGKRKDRMLARAVLDQFCKDMNREQCDLQIGADDIIVERGNPVEMILTESKARNCDLIVMGTHGHGTLADAMLGSTARRVIRRSTIPVLVVRIPEDSD